MSKTKLVPFDIEKAKAGAKVVTRGGDSVKISDYNAQGDNTYPLRCIVLNQEESFTKEGKFSRLIDNSCFDLFIEEEVEEDDSNYDPYKATVESIADMVERYSELQSLEELKHFYNNVKVKCREAVEYDNTWNKKQDEKPANNKPKFKVGDVMRTLEEAKADITEGLPEVISIDDVNYHCNNETIAIKDQEDYEYPPMNRFVLPDKWYTCIESWSTIDMKIGDWFEEGHYYLGSDILKYKGLLEKDEDFKDYFHPWNISDVKPGDVLASKNGENILIFRQITSGTGFSSYYNTREAPNVGWSNDFFIPATKEQRDLLFRKMKEAGYEWDSDKKELKKIESEENEERSARMTNRELALWLRSCPEELRECKYLPENTICYAFSYREDDADKPVEDFFAIRRNGGEWQEPLIEL